MDKSFVSGIEGKNGFVETVCALCETNTHDKLLYPARLDFEALSYQAFSARHLPHRYHYRVVRCRRCGLVRSNPILDETALARLYAGSHFIYEHEASFAAETYLFYLRWALRHLEEEANLLEIGCGNGFFLQKARDIGIQQVFGIEPSQESVEKAGPLKPNIHRGMFRSGIYPEKSFNLICAFQVFDHISQPNQFLEQCGRYLKKEGIVLFINHDVGSMMARLLGENNAMIDIGHTFLYDRKTIRKIFEKNHYEILKIFRVANRYPLSYWLRLAPFVNSIKSKLIKSAQNFRIANIPLKLKVGNMGVIARVIK